jgi:hypothetical protein
MKKSLLFSKFSRCRPKNTQKKNDYNNVLQGFDRGAVHLLAFSYKGVYKNLTRSEEKINICNLFIYLYNI